MADREWKQFSPIPDHRNEADIDITMRNLDASSLIAGDFDGDGQDEIAIIIGTPPNSFKELWVKKFYPEEIPPENWKSLKSSGLRGHCREADIDCIESLSGCDNVDIYKNVQIGVKFSGDFNGDGRDEIAVSVSSYVAPLIKGFRVMKWTGEDWIHLGPNLQNDGDFKPPGEYVYLPVVVGDFDGDGQDEIAGRMAVSGSAANDFWVMKFYEKENEWREQWRFTCSDSAFLAKFAFPGDFDGDGCDEIIIVPGTRFATFTDFWAMKLNNHDGKWYHMRQLKKSVILPDADISCSDSKDLTPNGNAVAVGDFDGDRQDEIAIALKQEGSAGNDFWAMKFDKNRQDWIHMRDPKLDHPLKADFDCSGLQLATNQAIAGDFDGDGKDEIAVQIGNRQGVQESRNNFWIMKWYGNKWEHHPGGNLIFSKKLHYPATSPISGSFIKNYKRKQIAAIASGNDIWIRHWPWDL